MKTLITSILILLSIELLAQNYFEKSYSLAYTNSSAVISFQATDEGFLLVCDHICTQDQTECTSIIELSKQGDINNDCLFPTFHVGNDNVISSGPDNNLLIVGHTLLDNFFNYTSFIKPALVDCSDNLQRVQVNEGYENIFVEGILKSGNGYLTFGDGKYKSSNQIFGYIIKWNKSTDTILDSFLIKKSQFENHCDDLQFNKSGNLVFLNKYNNDDTIFDAYEIVELDTLFNLLRVYDYTPNDIDRALPNLHILKSGDYLFSVRGDFGLDSRKLIRVDYTTLEIIWNLNLPNIEDHITEYKIVDYANCTNGDFLVCGQFSTSNGTRGFLSRIDSFGLIKWMNKYPISGFSTFYSAINNVIEVDDNNIAISGFVIDSSSINRRDIYFASLDSTGCISSLSCEEIITSQNEVPIVKEDVNIYPNPAFSSISFELEQMQDILFVQIISLNGERVFQVDNLQKLNKVDLDGFQSGVYILQVVDKNSRHYNYRFIKI